MGQSGTSAIILSQREHRSRPRLRPEARGHRSQGLHPVCGRRKTGETRAPPDPAWWARARREKRALRGHRQPDSSRHHSQHIAGTLLLGGRKCWRGYPGSAQSPRICPPRLSPARQGRMGHRHREPENAGEPQNGRARPRLPVRFALAQRQPNPDPGRRRTNSPTSARVLTTPLKATMWSRATVPEVSDPRRSRPGRRPPGH